MGDVACNVSTINVMNTRPPNKDGGLVYILSQVIRQQLIETLDVQAKAIRAAV